MEIKVQNDAGTGGALKLKVKSASISQNKATSV